MEDEVLSRLSLAMQFVHHANFAGTPRQAVADAYSGVDAVLSALLFHAGSGHSFNHKVKLERARAAFPDVFAAKSVVRRRSVTHLPGTTWRSLEEFHAEWLAARYGDLATSPAQASARVREAAAVASCATRFLAGERGVSVDALEERVSLLAFGHGHSEVALAVGEMHDRLFLEAERIGEERGNRLGAKIAATTNHCALDITSGDRLTQSILAEDAEVAEEAARLYLRFTRLVDLIKTRRFERMPPGEDAGRTPEERLDEFPSFMLSLKARYHGATRDEIGRHWGRLLSLALSDPGGDA